MKTKNINFVPKTDFGSVAIPMFGARVDNGLFRKPGKNQSSLTSIFKKYSWIFNCLLLLFISNAQALVISYVSPGNTFPHNQIDLVQLPSNNNDWIGSIETVPNASALLCSIPSFSISLVLPARTSLPSILTLTPCPAISW